MLQTRVEILNEVTEASVEQWKSTASSCLTEQRNIVQLLVNVSVVCES